MDRIKEIEDSYRRATSYSSPADRDIAVEDLVRATPWLLSQLSAVTAERDRLREAAQPFVEAAKHVAIGFSDMDDIVYIDYDIFGGTTLSAGQLRALSAASKVQP